MAQVTGYQVWDRTANLVIATYLCQAGDEVAATKARRSAHRRADRRDDQYGAVCCSVRRMEA